MPPKSQKTAAAGRWIGYARVSADEQGTDPQRDELGAAVCSTILEEHAAGETLVVVRLDRLVRSVCHLLGLIEQLEASGGHFVTQPSGASGGSCRSASSGGRSWAVFNTRRIVGGLVVGS
jgi:DNA invertase Pin-like site-specific DNA recombinase